MFHCGRKVCGIAACEKTMSPGRRLTRPAPLRMAACDTAEIPLRLLLMLPASLIVSFSLNLRGGAKSRPVNVPDLRKRCLLIVSIMSMSFSLLNLRARNARHLIEGADERVMNGNLQMISESFAGRALRPAGGAFFEGIGRSEVDSAHERK
jgi:hypothetical protein